MVLAVKIDFKWCVLFNYHLYGVLVSFGLGVVEKKTERSVGYIIRPTQHVLTMWITETCSRPSKFLKGRIQGGRTRRASPLKLEKIWFFFWRKIDEIPQQFSCLPPQLEKIWFFGVKSWFFTRNTPKIFAPPSARRYFFKLHLRGLPVI